MVFGSVRDKALSFSGCSRVAELGCCTGSLAWTPMLKCNQHDGMQCLFNQLNYGTGANVRHFRVLSSSRNPQALPKP